MSITLSMVGVRSTVDVWHQILYTNSVATWKWISTQDYCHSTSHATTTLGRFFGLMTLILFGSH
jgi:hypothetical protein